MARRASTRSVASVPETSTWYESAPERPGATRSTVHWRTSGGGAAFAGSPGVHGPALVAAKALAVRVGVPSQSVALQNVRLGATYATPAGNVSVSVSAKIVTALAFDQDSVYVRRLPHDTIPGGATALCSTGTPHATWTVTGLLASAVAEPPAV